MTRGSPRTIWWYVTLDMWKLLLLTTAVLAAVIAFAMAVKPLADGKLGPLEAIKLMGLAMIPALQYVLPFAACFGATMAYHRMSVDNEVTACYAGGISHKGLLFPAIASGVVLAAMVWGLANYAIPHFFREMAKVVSADATRLIVSKIERGEAVPLGDALIYADKVVVQGPEEGAESTGAYERLWLGGLLMVRLDKQGNITGQGSAKSASVWLKRIAGEGDERPSTQVIIKPKDFVGVGATTRGGGSDAVTSFTVPNALADNPKFLTYGELNDLYDKPEAIDKVERARRALALTLAQRETIERVREALRTTGRAEFVTPFGDRVALLAAELRPTRRDGKRVANILNVVPPTAPSGGKKPIIVERIAADGRVVRQNAASAYVRLPASIDPQRPGVYITIHMEDVVADVVGDEAEAPAGLLDEEIETRETEKGGGGAVKERMVEDLQFVAAGMHKGAPGGGGATAESVLKEKMAASTGSLMRDADQRISVRALDADVLRRPSDALSYEVSKLLREVLSKQHERWAMSIACLVMVILGAVMALRLRDALPLTVYVWAFFPALVAMVAISGGQQMTYKHGAIGLVLLYAGVLALGIYAAWSFRRVARH